MNYIISWRSFLQALSVILVPTVLLEARDQSGFISIDCGAPPNSTYTDPTTGVNYISDASFINTGISKSIEPDLKNGSLEQKFWNVRSFPASVGRRNCYKINITRGTKYLIRTYFVYGNYDGLNKRPVFGLLIGANWLEETMDLAWYSYFEIIHKPSLDHIQICLANTGTGTPFISSIELRPVNNDTYVTQSGSLKLYWSAVDFGPPEDDTPYWYKDDGFDRSWSPYTQDDWKQVNVSNAAGPLIQNNYSLPEAVMRKAVSPVNASAPLLINWNSVDDNENGVFYFYMHFTEIEDLRNTNHTREFNITVNGEPWYQNLVPPQLSTVTIYSKSPSKGINIRLEKTQRSTLPPIINALEVYSVIDLQKPDTFQGDVDAVTTIRSVYGLTRDWQGDPCSPVDYLWDGLNCTYYRNNPPRITTLNLSSSGLTGTIHPSISQLTMLKILDFSNNCLTGDVHDFLSELHSLRVLKLEENQLSGTIPPEILQKSNNGSLYFSFGGVPNCCPPGSCKKKKHGKTVITWTATVGGALILFVAVIFWIFKTKKSAVATSDKTRGFHSKTNRALYSDKQEFTYDEVLTITNGFGRVLGRGAFGTVYHGYLGNNSEVAVKILSPSARGYQQFQAEAELLTKVHHKCLTALIGYCNEDTKLALIYEYMANGDLAKHLSAKSGKFLGWEARLQIAVDAAEGLEYLHHGCQPPIVHRDIKPQNILLNERMHGKLGDFGLSKIFSHENDTHVSTVIAGTRGYLDPECCFSNRLNEKSDVYSFGVVLLEIITGQPAIGKTEERTHIVKWLDSMLREGEVNDVVDSRLGREFCPNSVREALYIAVASVRRTSNNRPTMTEVMIKLKECLAMEMNRASDNIAYSINENSMDTMAEESYLAR